MRFAQVGKFSSCYSHHCSQEAASVAALACKELRQLRISEASQLVAAVTQEEERHSANQRAQLRCTPHQQARWGSCWCLGGPNSLSRPGVLITSTTYKKCRTTPLLYRSTTSAAYSTFCRDVQLQSKCPRAASVSPTREVRTISLALPSSIARWCYRLSAPLGFHPVPRVPVFARRGSGRCSLDCVPLNHFANDK